MNWTSEVECFKSFLRELAYFYVPEPLLNETAGHTDGQNACADTDAKERAVKWQIQHIIFPAMARYMEAPKSLVDRDVIQVAHLPDLYRVFERC